MGCCCSTSDQDIYEDGEAGDKTNLLGSPVGETSRSGSLDRNITRPSPSPAKGDEQDKLNRILQKTANSYIDVPALNSPVEQPNCFAKERHYGEKIKTLKRYQSVQKSHSILEDIPQPEAALATNPLSTTDKKMVNDYNTQIVSAIQNIKVCYSDSIIIPFTEPSKQ